MKWIFAFIAFFILADIFGTFNRRAIDLEERVNKLEEALGLHKSNENE